MTEEELELSESEKAKARATSLFIIEAIVARYGGTVDIDLATHTLNITVPPEEQAACAHEIDMVIGTMCE
jgi:methylmalonyl-CoA mutase N-terminal domain/subunit